MIEVYKTVQNVNPSFMKEIFVQKEITHNLPMHIPKSRTSSCGIESLSFLGCKLWNSLPVEFKSIRTLASFKGKLKDGVMTALQVMQRIHYSCPFPYLTLYSSFIFYFTFLCFIFLLLCKYVIIFVSYYLKYGFL